MGCRGRPTLPRKTQLGLKLETFRKERGWSVSRLAKEVGISYKTLSKLELSRIRPRHAELLRNIAEALEVHPDELLVPASLTPILKPSMEEGRHAIRKSVPFIVDDNERRQLEYYLQYLRYIAEIELVARSSG